MHAILLNPVMPYIPRKSYIFLNTGSIFLTKHYITNTKTIFIELMLPSNSMSHRFRRHIDFIIPYYFGYKYSIWMGDKEKIRLKREAGSQNRCYFITGKKKNEFQRINNLKKSNRMWYRFWLLINSVESTKMVMNGLPMIFGFALIFTLKSAYIEGESEFWKSFQFVLFNMGFFQYNAY